MEVPPVRTCAAGFAEPRRNDLPTYNDITGKVMFDADGSGAGAARAFASIAPGLALTAADFEVG